MPIWRYIKFPSFLFVCLTIIQGQQIHILLWLWMLMVLAGVSDCYPPVDPGRGKSLPPISLTFSLSQWTSHSLPTKHYSVPSPLLLSLNPVGTFHLAPKYTRNSRWICPEVWNTSGVENTPVFTNIFYWSTLSFTTKLVCELLNRLNILRESVFVLALLFCFVLPGRLVGRFWCHSLVSCWQSGYKDLQFVSCTACIWGGLGH